MASHHWAGRTVVVTGGAGFIGSHFVTELLARRAEVIRLHRRSALAPLEAPGLRDVMVDLTDEAALRAAFDSVPRGVDMVVHCAAMWGSAGFRYDRPATVFEANARPLANVLRCAQRSRVRDVVLLGSGEIYRSSLPRPLREDDDVVTDGQQPVDGYYSAKAHEHMLAAAYRHEYGMNVFQPRLTGVYGPGDNFAPGADRVIPALLARAAAGEEVVIWGDGSQTRTYMYVTDAVRAILQVVEANRHHVVNVGTAETVSLRGLAEMACAAVSGPARIRFDAGRPTGRSSRTLDLSRLDGIIDFRPRDLREGLRQTAEWYLGTLDRA